METIPALHALFSTLRGRLYPPSSISPLYSVESPSPWLSQSLGQAIVSLFVILSSLPLLHDRRGSSNVPKPQARLLNNILPREKYRSVINIEMRTARNEFKDLQIADFQLDLNSVQFRV